MVDDRSHRERAAGSDGGDDGEAGGGAGSAALLVGVWGGDFAGAEAGGQDTQVSV